MDRFIATMPARDDGDLRICDQLGVAYQADMTVTASYDEAYMDRCASHPPQMVRDINALRNAFVDRFIPKRAAVVDIGVGDGAFIRSRAHTKGLDVNPAAVRWLRACGLNAATIRQHSVTMWDTLEHVPDPGLYLDEISVSYFLFVSIPVFSDLKRIRESRHYRPGEHLYYFTDVGFVEWMNCHGFQLKARDDFESRLGRDTIATFAFKRVGPAWETPSS